MNSTYLAIVLFILAQIAHFIFYVVLMARQRGRDEAKMAEIAVQGATIEQLSEDAAQHRLMTESIMVYLETKNGYSFRRR